MKIEKRKYKITGFRDLENGFVRVILSLYQTAKLKEKIDPGAIISDPFSFADRMIKQQFNNMIHDTFLISKKEYEENNYKVGEIITVALGRE